MKIRILSALVSMTFMLLFVPTAMANSEASKIKAGMVVVVNNPDAEDRLNLRTEPRQDAPTLGNTTMVPILRFYPMKWTVG